MTGVYVTQHAAERFVERHRPDMGQAQAKAHLAAKAAGAARLKERTVTGQAQWQINDPPCALVVKHDRHLRVDVIVTVLPKPEPFKSDDPAELAAMVPAGAPPFDPAEPVDQSEVTKGKMRRMRRSLRYAARALARHAAWGDAASVEALELIQQEAPEFTTLEFMAGPKRSK